LGTEGEEIVGRMTVPDEAIKYVLFQRTAYLRIPNTKIYRALEKILPFSTYNQLVDLESRFNHSRIKTLFEDDMRREYVSIKKFLPEKCSAVLDIGCGVAGIDVFLNNHYRDRQPDFYLLDRTTVDKSVSYGFKPSGAFYNSLEVAGAVLIGNGVPERCVHLVKATDTNEIDIDCNVDLAISLLSWGFHYPIETYLDRVHDVLTAGGSLITDVRRGTNGIEALSRLFGKIDVIYDDGKLQRVLASR
jgi:SAM-dependent methyltransferase